MKIINFDYVDSKGNSSTRSILVTNTPTDKYSGIDLKELKEELHPSFLVDMEEVNARYHSDIEDTMYRYGLDNSFRQFIKDRMTNVVEVE